MKDDKNISFDDHIKNSIKSHNNSIPIEYQFKKISLDSDKVQKLKVLVDLLQVLNQTKKELIQRDSFTGAYDLTLKKIIKILVDY